MVTANVKATTKMFRDIILKTSAHELHTNCLQRALCRIGGATFVTGVYMYSCVYETKLYISSLYFGAVDIA